MNNYFKELGIVSTGFVSGAIVDEIVGTWWYQPLMIVLSGIIALIVFLIKRKINKSDKLSDETKETLNSAVDKGAEIVEDLLDDGKINGSNEKHDKKGE